MRFERRSLVFLWSLGFGAWSLAELPYDSRRVDVLSALALTSFPRDDATACPQR